MVVLEKTGETIVNPYDGNNLAGMCESEILRTEYFTASLVQFNNDSSQTLRVSISKEDALKNLMKGSSS